MKKQEACDLNVKVIYALDIKSFSIVNIQTFRLREIYRSHMIKNISVMSTLTLSTEAMTKFFLKIVRYLELEPSNLKIELAQDIIIPNNCVKIH